MLLVSRNYHSKKVGMFSHVPDQINFPQEEEKILRLWKELDAFQTSLKQSKDRPRLVKTRDSIITINNMQRVLYSITLLVDYVHESVRACPLV